MFDACCFKYVWQWYPDMFWHVWCTRRLLVVHCNVFVMFEHVPLLSQAFYFASGGLLPCLMPVYSYMFDRWYPDMIWHVWCKRMLLVVHCNVFVMFEHVPLLSQAFYLASGGMLPCLMPVYLYMFDRWYPDMFWHVYTGMFMLSVWLMFIYICLTGVLLTWVPRRRWWALNKKKCCMCQCFEMSWWGSLEVK